MEGTLAEETVAAKDYGRTYLAATLPLYLRAELKCGAYYPGIAVGGQIGGASDD